MNAPSWARRIERATELMELFPAADEILKFYRAVVAFQESIYELLRRSGKTDLQAVASRMPELCAILSVKADTPLARRASEVLREGSAAWEGMLRSCWEEASGEATGAPDEFLTRALVQPYAEYLASRGNASTEGGTVCPFCSARPVAGVLRQEGDGGRRSLICSLCATEWLYRRLVCPNCGETDKDKLPVYKAEGISHVRVEACDSCRSYLKSVDLTINGLAVPVVDEVATIALDVWAEEAGYRKRQTNLLGF